MKRIYVIRVFYGRFGIENESLSIYDLYTGFTYTTKNSVILTPTGGSLCRYKGIAIFHTYWNRYVTEVYDKALTVEVCI